jgi:DNA-binding GntR family transcriptional regulator
LLPSESALARAAGTNRYSVRKGLALLREEGLIEAVPGLGWVVTDPNPPVDRLEALPRYRQIAAELRAGVQGGQSPRGGRLPSETELMARFEVSRSTVRLALTLLQADGLVVARPGRGWYVARG